MRSRALPVLLSLTLAPSLTSAQSGDAAQTAKVTQPADERQAAAKEKVTGIGGLFFRARDPKALSRWYLTHLGIALTPPSYEEEPWRQEAGPTVFAPFPDTTRYFGRAQQAWMANFRVRNLDAMAAQLKAGGIDVAVDPKEYPNGRFARIHDPEGNPIELWEPGAAADTSRGAASFVNRVWVVAESPQIAKGETRVFLSDGTLVMTAPHAKPAFGTWQVKDGALTITEEGLKYPVDVLELTATRFHIRIRSPGEPVVIRFAPADQPVVSLKPPARR